MSMPPAGSPPLVQPLPPQPAPPADPSAGTPAVEPGEPPVRDPGAAYQAAMLDERKKRQALEAKLAEFEARDAAAERKRLEEAGEHQRLRELAEQEREVARSEAQRARRDAVLARRQISESDALLVHAAYGLLPEADRPPFAEWVDAGIKPGGALHRFVAPAEPEPAGTRARGKTTEPIDPDVLAEATRRKQRGGALYEDVTAEQLARDMQARRASKK